MDADFGFEHLDPACPICGGSHVHRLVARSSAARGQPVLVYGAEDVAPPDDANRTWDVFVECPVQHRRYQLAVPVPPAAGAGVRSVEPAAEAAPRTEMDEWVRASAATAREFGKTALSAALTTVPIYFAVVKYVQGSDPARGWQVAAIVPAVLLVAASGALAYAIRPTLAPVTDAHDFAGFRDRRLREMQRRLNLGLALLVAAAVSAVVVLAGLLLW